MRALLAAVALAGCVAPAADAPEVGSPSEPELAFDACEERGADYPVDRASLESHMPEGFSPAARVSQGVADPSGRWGALNVNMQRCEGPAGPVGLMQMSTPVEAPAGADGRPLCGSVQFVLVVTSADVAATYRAWGADVIVGEVDVAAGLPASSSTTATDEFRATAASIAGGGSIEIEPTEWARACWVSDRTVVGVYEFRHAEPWEIRPAQYRVEVTGRAGPVEDAALAGAGLHIAPNRLEFRVVEGWRG